MTLPTGLTDPEDGIRRCCIKHETEDLKVEYGDRGGLHRLFIVCENCGNKRCPKASDCSLDCTGSNASGQPGSVFTRLAENTNCSPPSMPTGDRQAMYTVKTEWNT